MTSQLAEKVAHLPERFEESDCSTARLLAETGYLDRPQDLKVEVERLTSDEAVGLAAFLAHVVGRGHARQLDAAARTRWAKTLQASRSKSLDAPSWLWNSVVDLIALHEAAYLEHCRNYTLVNKT